MLSKTLAVAALTATTSAASNDPSNHWAVIVAGSKTYSNYRHQADTCHAYQVMKKNGIPEDQIIHMSYDDVAHSWRNPYKGKLFNAPSDKGTPGVDVYDGCKMAYKKKDVTAKNLSHVLRGESDKVKGPVLKSDENSEIFFYFADHGAPGLIAMPQGSPMYADKLHEDFQYMFENKMYNQMTVYIEACESGSMFENILEDNMNIYAVTAANSTESSWGTYCSPNDKVNGKKIKSCLGDLFSVNWLEDSDKADMAAESLQQQYSAVRDLTTKSEVLQWGEVDFTAEPIGEFQSGGIPAEKTVSESLWNQIKHKTPKMIKDMFEINAESQRKALSAVSSRDIDLHFWYNIAVDEPTEENLQALQDYITYRKKVDDTVEAIFGTEFMSNLEGTKNLPTDFECYRTMINKFQEQCFEADGYNMKYYKAFVAHCEFAKNFPEGEELVQKTLDKMDEVCQH